MPISMRHGQPDRRANILTARFIPLLLVAIIGYCTWVFVKLIVIDFLLNPNPRLLLSPRTGPAITVLVIYSLLLIVLLVCYGRLVQTIITNPGLLPRGRQWFLEQDRRRRSRRRPYNDKDSLEADSVDGYELAYRKSKHARDDDYQVQNFWLKDVFITSFDGRPPFCSHCYNYKVDRVHHCSELDRCVLKMDHFCPWVAGIISENSFKYFVQFTFYTTLFTFHTLVVAAYYFAERRRRESFINVHWILIIALAALFFIFGAGMCGSSLQFAFENTTTIENLDRRSHVWYVAVHIPERILQRYLSSGRNDLRLITYPRPAAEQFQILEQAGATISRDSAQSGPTPPPPTHDPSRTTNTPPSTLSPPIAASQTKTFAILETAPGANPFDLGLYDNFKDVMGYTVLEWFLPILPSPCTYHGAPECMYTTGPVVEKLRRDAGIADDDDGEEGKRTRRGSGSGSHSHTHSTHSHSHSHSHSGRRKNRRRHRKTRQEREDVSTVQPGM